MSGNLIDVRNPRDLVSGLSQVLLFVEQLNERAFSIARALYRSSEAGPVRVPRLAEVVRRVRNACIRPGAKWGSGSTVLELAGRAGVQPLICPALIDRVEQLLLDLDLPRIQRPEKLRTRLHTYEGLTGLSFASRAIGPSEAGAAITLEMLYWDEPWDPIAVIQLFLSDALGERGRSVDHYLQQWLCSAFSLPRELDFTLPRICDKVNLMFYESAVPSSEEIHVRRPATIGTSLLVTQLLRLVELATQSPSAGETLSPELSLRRALGVYLAIRFCRQLRCRFAWFPDDRASLTADAAGSAPRPFGDSQCVSALRPLGHTYFQARVFGRISATPGLSNIFRGGLLAGRAGAATMTLIGPPGAGKTVFGLQLMADVAAAGGLGVYFSFEESYDSIVRRLLAFDLFDDAKFFVEQAGVDFAQVVDRLTLEDPHKGILILYDDRTDESGFDLASVIRSLAAASARFEANRALVIDSVSALEIRETNQDPYKRRLGLRELVSVIEAERFFGLILSERDDVITTPLSFLTDTVIQMGLDDSDHTRWIEITKCRFQDYQGGRHPFRMVDRRGIVIYPSLVSRRSSIRRRVKSTLSEEWGIPLPSPWRDDLKLDCIKGKSSSLLWGPPGGGKTLILLHLLTTPSQPLLTLAGSGQGGGLRQRERPRNVLLITFRTSEVLFMQALREEKGLCRRWEAVPKKKLRWYSPGENLTADQIVSEIWRYLSRSRREGRPVERIAFDETEVAEDFLPGLKREHLLWPTLLDLTSAEAATAFFVCGTEDRSSPLIRMLRASVDYIFNVGNGLGSPARDRIRLEKSPSLKPENMAMWSSDGDPSGQSQGEAQHF